MRRSSPDRGGHGGYRGGGGGGGGGHGGRHPGGGDREAQRLKLKGLHAGTWERSPSPPALYSAILKEMAAEAEGGDGSDVSSTDDTSGSGRRSKKRKQKKSKKSKKSKKKSKKGKKEKKERRAASAGDGDGDDDAAAVKKPEEGVEVDNRLSLMVPGAAAAAAAIAAAAAGDGGGGDEDSDLEVGPMPVGSGVAATSTKDYGKGMLQGEADALAEYAREGRRAPRRGEVGITTESIEQFESMGFVMSGSRHKKMNAVRIRKENQVCFSRELTFNSTTALPCVPVLSLPFAPPLPPPQVLSAEEERKQRVEALEERLTRENTKLQAFKDLVSSKAAEKDG